MAAIQPTLFDIEQWLPVVGYEGYYDVSNHGRVRSRDRVILTQNGQHRRYRGTILSPSVHKSGRRIVQLNVGNRQRSRYVHQLVLESFVGPRPSGMEGCHYDDDPSNNHLSNLRWDTREANERDKLRNSGHYLRRKTHCPRGHLLEEPNLVRGPLKRGHRTCLACSRTSAHIQRYPSLRPDIQKVSDSYYRALMADSAA